MATTRTPLGLHVLVVEDDPASRMFLERALLRLGCTVNAVGDGDTAVALAAHACFDVVFMDVRIPGRDGLSATQAIRQNAGFQPCIIGLSAFAFDSDRRAGMDAGMDMYLAKPVDLSDLELTLRNLEPGDHNGSPTA